MNLPSNRKIRMTRQRQQILERLASQLQRFYGLLQHGQRHSRGRLVGPFDRLVACTLLGFRLLGQPPCGEHLVERFRVPIDGIDVGIDRVDGGVEITVTVRVSARTGVEMEALTAASVAALTIYDMCKAVDRGMVIESVRLEEKSGGKSGHWRRSDFPDA